MSNPDKIYPEWSRRFWHTLDLAAGSALDRGEVKSLERILQEDPDDRIAHLLLAGYYRHVGYTKRVKAHDLSEYVTHVGWFIENEPDHPDLAELNGIPETECYKKLRSLWYKALRMHPKNLQVLVNAAHFFLLSIKTRERLWKRVVALEPNNADWHRQLSSCCRFQANNPKQPEDREYAKKAIQHLKKALELNEKNPDGVYFFRVYLAYDLQELLSVATRFKMSEEAMFLREFEANQS